MSDLALIIIYCEAMYIKFALFEIRNKMTLVQMDEFDVSSTPVIQRDISFFTVISPQFFEILKELVHFCKKLPDMNSSFARNMRLKVARCGYLKLRKNCPAK